MKCNICGTENQEGAKYCSVCGSQLEQKVVEPQDNIYNQDEYMYTTPPSSMATVAMVLGIIAIVSGATCCLFIIAVLTGIPAVILGIIALVKHKPNSTRAIVGLILGGIGLLWGGYLLLSVCVVLANPELMEEYRNTYEEILRQNGYTFKLIKSFIK